MPKQIPIWQLIDAFEDDEFIPPQTPESSDDEENEDEYEPECYLSFAQCW